MSGEAVLDASVVADWLLPGARSPTAMRFMQSDVRRIAPALIFAELASVAVKITRRGLVSKQVAREAVARLPSLIDDVAPLDGLAAPAYDLAARHGFSAYDAIYLSLALRRDLPLITADAKLARRAMDVGLAGHVRLLTPETRP